MKAICFILSIYVACLSTIICCSDDDCSDEVHTECANNHSHDQEDNHNDFCSPFLTCGTCTGFTFFKTEFVFAELQIVEDKLVISKKAQFIDYYYANIWQPPKIS